MKLRTSIKVKCDACGKQVIKNQYKLGRNKHNFCNKKCFWKFEETSKLGTKYHWKGGKYFSRGYVLVYAKDHPNKNGDGYVLEHRLVMEKKLGRYLKKKEQVHHINRNKADNRIKNLMLFSSNSEHIKHHWKEKR